MENGIDTMGLMKSLEEGKSKLVCSNTSAISDYDVDSHIRQYHDNAIASTLEESLSLFDAKCSTKIWKMMNQEFLNTRSAILDSENRQSNLRSPSQPSSSLPLSTRKLVTPPITTAYSKDDDVSKLVIYEPILKDLFDDLCLNKSPAVAERLLETLKNSHQDLAGEVFCWKLLIAQLNLTSVPLRHYRKKDSLNEQSGVLNSVLFLQREFVESMRRAIIRARSIQQLPDNDLRSLVCAYVQVLFDGRDKAGLDLDSQSLTPLWPQLFCLLRAGADLQDIDAFADDILRFGGAVGQDVLRMLQEYVRVCRREPLAMAASEYSARMTRLRAMAHRLCGAGDSDMHKLMLLSLLANESPYNTTPVTHPTTGELLVPQQEVLRTLQDWLWHKLLVVHLNTLLPHDHADDPADFKLAALRQRIEECGSEYFDPTGDAPFSYVQTLLVAQRFDTAVLYLLQRHWLVSAVALAAVLELYGVLRGSDDLYVTTLLRLLPHVTQKPVIFVHLAAFVGDAIAKKDLLVVGVASGRHVDASGELSRLAGGAGGYSGRRLRAQPRISGQAEGRAGGRGDQGRGGAAEYEQRVASRRETV